MSTTNTRPDAAHWHVFADSAGDISTRLFPEDLTKQQAHDLADTLAHVDSDAWNAVWVQPCPVNPGRCTFWALTGAFDPDTTEPRWQRTL